MGNSPAPSSPPDERGGLGAGQSGTGRVTSATGKQRSGFLPLSDSNVSTTHQDAAVANWHQDDLNVS